MAGFPAVHSPHRNEVDSNAITDALDGLFEGFYWSDTGKGAKGEIYWLSVYKALLSMKEGLEDG